MLIWVYVGLVFLVSQCVTVMNFLKEQILAYVNEAVILLLHNHERNPPMSCFSIHRGKRGKDCVVHVLSTKTTFPSKLPAYHHFVIKLIFIHTIKHSLTNHKLSLSYIQQKSQPRHSPGPLIVSLLRWWSIGQGWTLVSDISM
jgi:hypothetical protein